MMANFRVNFIISHHQIVFNYSTEKFFLIKSESMHRHGSRILINSIQQILMKKDPFALKLSVNEKSGLLISEKLNLLIGVQEFFLHCWKKVLQSEPKVS